MKYKVDRCQTIKDGASHKRTMECIYSAGPHFFKYNFYMYIFNTAKSLQNPVSNKFGFLCYSVLFFRVFIF